ncbi:MAG: phenylalanine--tRNA ligase subunit beta [Clostridia bacterium]|nr:phenylalanine--tRNA ligase subunit beta [Clostridia bacterium]
MKLPKSWLKEYVDFHITDEEFIERMMWRGFELGGLTKELPCEGVVVGRVDDIRRHENSDHLWICQVDVGSERLQIVTGARNVTAGALVPVAVVGSTLGGRRMEAVQMRGVESRGMLCSGSELGLSEADYPGAGADGILLLHGEHPLGKPIEAALGFDDVIFEFELTPNRPDCIGILGMCREAAAALGQPFRAPAPKKLPGEGDEADYASVAIENYALCPRYTARVVKDIRIAPSPAWMQRRLKSVGLRPINNIVDITNYVLVEYGHPMHAFDLACVEGGHIVVRNAKENELVTTLDGKRRAVTPDMLLIADPHKGVGIAGVMGGENSEITEDTKVVLYESAVFLGSNIRATARKLRHVTDAAARFIKGVEPVNALLALDRAVELTVELGAGTVVGATIDAGHGDYSERSVRIDAKRVNALLGLSLPPEEMARMLGTIDIPAAPEGPDGLRVTIPHFRTDIETGIEADADIAEEIARIYGYYNIAPTLMRGDTFRGRIPDAFRIEDAVKDALAAGGAYEMYNYNFTGPRTTSCAAPCGS